MIGNWSLVVTRVILLSFIVIRPPYSFHFAVINCYSQFLYQPDNECITVTFKKTKLLLCPKLISCQKPVPTMHIVAIRFYSSEKYIQNQFPYP